MQALDNGQETCYNVSSPDGRMRALVFAIREAALIIARGCDDFLDLPHSRPSKKDQGRRE